MTKLWGGRFADEADERFARFNASFRFDRRLFEVDIRASLAYAEALCEAGVLSRDDAAAIERGLQTILDRGRREPAYLERGVQQGIEDVHSFVEAELVNLIGDAGRKLHTGRSRNDQVATDLRLYLRESIDEIQGLIKALQRALLDLAEAHQDVAMPGYTHLQRAQPVLWPHYLLAYFEMFARDRARLREIRARVNVMPLGSGALAGTNYPIDRQRLADRLGFEAISRNSLDAVSDRDFVIEFIAAAALIMVHLSRLAEDFIIFSTSEFGFIELSDRVATGSSLMPQKKNPDALELVRGKAGRVFGHHLAMLTVMKGLPLGYNKDLQEDKESLFDTIDTLTGCLSVMTVVLKNTRVRSERLIEAASRSDLYATELADYLVGKGMPFRQAHELVGRLVRYGLERGKRLDELSLEEYREFSPLFESDVYEALSLDAALARKDVPGGTAPARVAEALAAARRRL
ncbi:MAG: argininosuccinate lyase [Acidobacteria bacterium]|nr:MAG: argininosuccinate lyase [Acidobacteriota bacterium]